MKQNFRVGKQFPGSHSGLPSEPLPVLVRLCGALTTLQIDESSLAQLLDSLTQLSQATQVHSFRLGDEIGIEDWSVICQGRVRILCQGAGSRSPESSRAVTAQLLEADEFFGAEALLLTDPLPYRAIAASPVQVACLPQALIAPLLEQYPAFRTGLQRQAQQRDQLIFWRMFTRLRSLSSQQLQLLLPYLEEVSISASTPLATAAPGERGCFWLRQGQVWLSGIDPSGIDASQHDGSQSGSDESDPSQPPSKTTPETISHAWEADRLALGAHWGYPEATPDTWVAVTDLRLYCLPQTAWESVTGLLPQLPELLGNRANASLSPIVQSLQSLQSLRSAQSAQRSQPSQFGQLNQSAQSGQSPQTSGRLSRQVEARAETGRVSRSSRVVHLKPEVTETLPDSQPEPIDFPKPLRRHFMDWFERFPWVEQQSSSDCGAACLSMICQYWGKKVPIYLLREQANVNREGASLKSLSRAAENLGFHARPVRASLGRMAEINHPWIAHWQGAHYVVVYRIRGNQVIIADPAEGRRTLSRKKFQQQWTGYALLIDPTERLDAIEIKQASLSRYLSALLPYRNVAFQVILLSVLIQIFGLVTPLFTQIILDKVVIERSLPTLNIFALGLLLFGIWNIGITAIRQYLLSYLSNRLDLTLISGFIRHTLKLPLKFFQMRRVGDIITRVQENEKIQRFLVQKVVVAWLDFVTGFVYLGLMFYYNWQLTLLVVGLIPPIILFTLAATPLLRQVSREIFKEVADQNSVLVEMITGVATVKAAAAEGEMRWRWEDHLTGQTNAVFKGQKLGIRLQAIGGFISTIGSTALLWYGASLVIRGGLSVGQLVAFNMMLGLVISPVVSLANLWDELQEVLISVERLNDVFESTPEESAQKPLLVLPGLRGNIAFEGVTFRYNEDEETNILQNITFDAHPGELIAIVGRSGSGKSTLVNLIQGLYQPTKGRVMIDGHDISHVSLASLRSQFGVSPQESFLFSGTILENISLFRSGYSLEDVIEVAKLAEAHVFIQALPLGYNTKVGERGSSLSGGQRQRIAIARALLGHPRVLILDEATSSLDSESERRFQRNLMQIRRERTTFIIAHRFSTVRNADRILVIDRGCLVEQGSHEQLISQAGLYHHLAHQQLEL